MEVFVASHAPRPRMLVFGAIDFAAALARQAALLGYRVTVCDARPVFATPARFPAADEVVVDWPDRYLRAQAGRGALDAAHRDLRAHPRPQVRRAGARGGAAAARGRLRRRDGLAATHLDRLDRLREAGLTGRRAGPAVQPDRPGPGRPHPRGDRGVDHRARSSPAAGAAVAVRWPRSDGRIHHDAADDPAANAAASTSGNATLPFCYCAFSCTITTLADDVTATTYTRKRSRGADRDLNR